MVDFGLEFAVVLARNSRGTHVTYSISRLFSFWPEIRQNVNFIGQAQFFPVTMRVFTKKGTHKLSVAFYVAQHQ